MFLYEEKQSIVLRKAKERSRNKKQGVILSEAKDLGYNKSRYKKEILHCIPSANVPVYTVQ